MQEQTATTLHDCHLLKSYHNIPLSSAEHHTFDELLCRLLVVGGVLCLRDLRVEVRVRRAGRARDDQGFQRGNFGLQHVDLINPQRNT